MVHQDDDLHYVVSRSNIAKDKTNTRLETKINKDENLSGKMSRIRRVCLVIGILLLVLIAILTILVAVALGRALTVQEAGVDIDVVKLDDRLIDQHLDVFKKIFAESIKFKTIAKDVGSYDRDELLKLNEFLKKSFPLISNSSFITVEIVNELSILLSIKGSDKRLKPYMLTGHLDVVPVAADQWLKDPFLGEIVSDPISGENVIWGRGAIDDKIAVVGILSAMQILVGSGWEPVRSFFVGFGHDEEVGGNDGAGHIGRLLQRRGVELDFLIDEGVPITKGVMPGVSSPVAIIGVTEKGSMSIRIEAEGTGGHSSIPSSDQAVSSLATAIHNLYQHPQPSMFGLGGPEEDMLKYIAPKSDWPYKLVFANTWLFRPLLPYGMSQRRESNAIIRTTTAATMVRAGIKDNIVPATAWALVNHRVHPSQTLDEVFQHDVAAIADPKIKLTITNSREPHPISSYGADSIPYNILTSVLKSVYPEIISAPGFPGTGDNTGHYFQLTKQVYRILPIVLTSDEVSKYHGRSESVSVENFSNAIKFFRTFILTAESDQAVEILKNENVRERRHENAG